MKTAIHKDELPREKLIKYGPEQLSDYELLAIILNTGTKKENVLELSKRITKKYSLKELSAQSVAALTKELGIGNAKACKVLAISELARRLQLPDTNKKTIESAHDVAQLLTSQIAHKQTEQLIAIFLTARKRVITIQTLFTGSLDEAFISPREIFKGALEQNAAALILAHNHPSNDESPSKADIEATKEIQKAGELMHIMLLDHVIITRDNYYSLREHGYLS